MRGFEDLHSSLGNEQFIGMTFYFTPPYDSAASDARAAWYGINGTPWVMFDGGLGNNEFVGGQSSGSMYFSYLPAVQNQMGISSPLVIDAMYTLIEGEATITTDILTDAAVLGTNNRFQIFVCQDNLHGHPNMVVDMLPSEAFGLTAPGQSVQFTHSFTMDPSWNQPDLNIILMVQNMDTKEVLQAALAVPDYKAAIVLDCEPDGVEAEWAITGPGIEYGGKGDKLLNFFQAGEYTVTWETVPYWNGPTGPQVATVAEYGDLIYTGQYTDGPFTHQTAGDLGHAGPSRAASMVDIDNDGDLDLHVVQENGIDQLLENEGGVFTDIAAGNIANAGPGRGAAWADINGDGHLDVYLSQNGTENLILVGDGSGGFATVTSIGADNAGPGNSVSWVDFNQDGNLDLYVTNYGDADVLLQSQGEISPNFFLFSDVSSSLTSGVNSSAAIWTDGNLDGRLDLFLTNQFSTNLYYENTAFGFNDLTSNMGLGDLGKGMGAAFGDYDNDGDFDLYLANDGMTDILYSASGPFTFNQVLGDNLGDPGNGRGVTWADFNNDTFLDLYVTRFDQPDLFLIGDGTGGFTRVPVGPAEADAASNTCATGDIDGDGDIDIFVTREGQTNVLFQNDIADGNHWIMLHLEGSGANTCAIGARVVLTADGVSQSRLITPGSGYLGSNAMGVHFGLGAARSADQVEIHWPSGAIETVGPLVGDQVWQVTEGQALSAVDDGVPAVVTSLGLAHPNPFNPMTTIDFALSQAGHARVDVFTVDGRLVRTLADRAFGNGPHQVTWNGTDQNGRPVASGAYFYRLTTAGGFSEAGRMVLVK